MADILVVADRDASKQRRLLLRLLWCCGMRIGEACALTLSDIDTSAGTILITHAKGDRSRLLPMSETLWEYAADYLERCGLTDADGTLPLMPTARGNPPRSSNAGAALSPLFKKASVLTRHGNPIRPHDLRHSYAVHALEKMVEEGLDAYGTTAAFHLHGPRRYPQHRVLPEVHAGHAAEDHRRATANIPTRVRGCVMKEFPALLQTFLVDYGPKRRGFSTHTLASYRDAFVLLLKWMNSHESVAPEKVTMSHLDPDRIGRFVRWLREDRGCTPSTSNTRVAAIKSFAKFAQSDAPEHIETCRRLLEIPSMKTPRPAEVEFLTVRAVQLVVAAASTTLRELAIVSVLYDSGARVSEICGITVGDVTLSRPHTARVIGKGRKARVIPLSAQVGEILSRYIAAERAHTAPTEPLFVNRSRTALGRAGIAYVLQKHVTAAHRTHPEEVPPKAHPHLMRHSKAMHLLDANVNLIYIRDFLGHESVTTTEIYARASTEAKRRAINAGEASIIPEGPYGKEQRADLVAWLRHLL